MVGTGAVTGALLYTGAVTEAAMGAGVTGVVTGAAALLVGSETRRSLAHSHAASRSECPASSLAAARISGQEMVTWTQKSRVKAEKTKIFFQKASSGFGDVSFKERSGRFKA